MSYTRPRCIKLPPPPLSAISGQLVPGRPSGCCLCLYLLFSILLLFPYSFFVLLFLLLCICFVFACYFSIVFCLVFDFSAALLISSVSVSPSSIHCRAFFRTPPRQAFNNPSIVQFWLARDQLLFPCIYVVYLLVISHFSIGLLLGVMLGPDLWVVDVNFILAFRSMRTSVSPKFSTLNAKK
jgi:hypothetical protein